MTPDPVPPNGILPWTRSCFVCGDANPHGLHLHAHHENGVVTIAYTPREADRGWATIVHGGIAITLLDEVMTWAAIVKARRACVAAELTTRLKHPIRVGTPLRIEAAVTVARDRLLTTRGRIVDAQGNLLYEATGKYVPMSDAQAALCADDFVEGPGAIPLARLFG